MAVSPWQIVFGTYYQLQNCSIMIYLLDYATFFSTTIKIKSLKVSTKSMALHRS